MFFERIIRPIVQIGGLKLSKESKVKLIGSDREGLGLGLGIGLGLGVIDRRSKPDRRSEPNAVLSEIPRTSLYCQIPWLTMSNFPHIPNNFLQPRKPTKYVVFVISKLSQLRDSLSTK